MRLDKVVVILQPNHYKDLAVTQPPNQCVRTSSLASPASSAGKRIIFLHQLQGNVCKLLGELESNLES